VDPSAHCSPGDLQPTSDCPCIVRKHPWKRRIRPDTSGWKRQQPLDQAAGQGLFSWAPRQDLNLRHLPPEPPVRRRLSPLPATTVSRTASTVALNHPSFSRVHVTRHVTAVWPPSLNPELRRPGLRRSCGRLSRRTATAVASGRRCATRALAADPRAARPRSHVVRFVTVG
jgi:hypothetical protein